MGLRGRGGAGGSSCLGGGPHIASRPRGGPSRSTSRESRCIAGPGASSPPFRALVSTEAWRLRMICPKYGTNPWHRLGQPGGPNQAVCSRVRRAALGEGRGPCGLRAGGEGRRGSRELDVREAAHPGPGLPGEASFPFPPGEGSKRPQPRPSMEPPRSGSCGLLPPGLMLLGRAAAQLVGFWARSSQSWEEAGLGVGLGGE